MISKISALVGLTLLLNTVQGFELSCTAKSNPPADAVCGVRGYVAHINAYDFSYDKDLYGSPEKCAKSCADRPTCKSTFYGLNQNGEFSFCVWYSDTVASTGFYPEKNSYYFGYDQSCFDCRRTAECPEHDGAHFYVGNTPFAIRCGTDFYGGDLARVDAATFTDCIESCASTMGCVDVAYRGTNCYLKSSATSARKDPDVMGAILVSVEDAQKNALSCPKSDGASFTGKNGDVYDIHCGVDYFGGDIASTYAETFEDCLNACSTTSGCVDVALHGKYCYLKGDVSDVRSDSDVWGARKRVNPKTRRGDISPLKRSPLAVTKRVDTSQPLTINPVTGEHIPTVEN